MGTGRDTGTFSPDLGRVADQAPDRPARHGMATGLRARSRPGRYARAVERPDAYGESFADVYDDWYGDVTDAAATARFVAARHRWGPVLELGVGTGRVGAAPAGSGLLGDRPRCLGSDAGGLRRPGEGPTRDSGSGRPGDAAVSACVRCGTARVQHVVQPPVRRPPTGALRPGGAAAHERRGAGGRNHERRRVDRRPHPFPRGQSLPSRRRDDGGDCARSDAQTITGQHLDLRSGGARARPWLLRWSTVSQLDSFAADAGLRLAERYASWDGATFSAASSAAVSVYRPDRQATSRHRRAARSVAERVRQDEAAGEEGDA